MKRTINERFDEAHRQIELVIGQIKKALERDGLPADWDNPASEEEVRAIEGYAEKIDDYVMDICSWSDKICGCQREVRRKWYVGHE